MKLHLSKKTTIHSKNEQIEKRKQLKLSMDNKFRAENVQLKKSYIKA
eukprot:UN26539